MVVVLKNSKTGLLKFKSPVCCVLEQGTPSSLLSTCPGANPTIPITSLPINKTASTVKPVLSGHSKIDKTKVFKTNGSLMKLVAFCNTFDLQ